jgi:5-methylcytosine-specific restriction protein A
MLREIFKSIFDNYLVDKAAYKEMPNRGHSGLPSANALKNELPTQLQKASSLYRGYKFKGSIGQAQMADIPHLCIFDTDITRSAQQGYYIVYLFNENMSSVYLSLNQGWTEYEKRFEQKEGLIQLRKNTVLAQRLLRSVYDFNLDLIKLTARRHRLGTGYENGNICSKRYDKGSLPTDEALINDLRNLIGVYKELKGLVGSSILDIDDIKDEEAFQDDIQTATAKEFPPGPIPKKKKRDLKATTTSRRDLSVAATALERAQYKCEVDPEHQTFISLKSGHPFMEAHHLIPLESEDSFNYSLDVPENVICLCPTCHRVFHNAEIGYRSVRIMRFYEERMEQLEQRGIGINLNALFGFYKLLMEET